MFEGKFKKHPPLPENKKRLNEKQCDPAFTFSRHGGVSEAKEGSESITTQIPLTSGSLAANGGGILAMPRCHRLHGATHRHDFRVVGTIFFLICVSAGNSSIKSCERLIFIINKLHARSRRRFSALLRCQKTQSFEKNQF